MLVRHGWTDYIFERGLARNERPADVRDLIRNNQCARAAVSFW
jgi:hypothetical protein